MTDTFVALPYSAEKVKGILNRDMNNKDVKYRMQGMKYKDVGGTSRTGLASLKDSELMKKHMKEHQENLGDEAIFFSAVGRDGNFIPNATMQWHDGRMIVADDKGVFRICDNKIIKERVEQEKQRRDYIEKVIDIASLSDDICRLVLSMDERTFTREFGANGKPANMEIDDELREVNCKPSFIEVLDPSGIQYARACAKFKLIIQHYWPVIDDLTPEKTAEDGE